MTIDITPEAVERLSGYRGTTEQLINALEAMPPRGGISGQVVAAEAAIRLRALSAALTASQAEPAAAYEAAASHVAHRFGTVTVPEAIRALTPADSKAALDRMIAGAEERGMRKAAGVCAAVRDTAKNLNIQQMAMGAIVCRDDILAAIPKGKDHE